MKTIAWYIWEIEQRVGWWKRCRTCTYKDGRFCKFWKKEDGRLYVSSITDRCRCIFWEKKR